MNDTQLVTTFTGAGDCWDAGLLAGIVHGHDLVMSGWLGAACAAYGVTAVGGTTAIPEYATVHTRACAAYEQSNA